MGSSTAIATLPNIGNAAGSSFSPYQYTFLDLDPNVAGVDTLYVADDATVANNGGIRKFAFDGTNWLFRGKANLSTQQFRGLTARVKAIKSHRCQQHVDDCDGRRFDLRKRARRFRHADRHRWHQHPLSRHRLHARYGGQSGAGDDPAWWPAQLHRERPAESKYSAMPRSRMTVVRRRRTSTAAC